jgi:hypothetical protein
MKAFLVILVARIFDRPFWNDEDNFYNTEL